MTSGRKTVLLADDERRRDAQAGRGTIELGGVVGVRGGAQPHPASGAADLLAAITDLQAAIAGLRGRVADVTRALDDAAPALAEAARAPISAGRAPTADEERRVLAAWGEVTELAQRLARAADALSAPHPRHAARET